jgi:hypothetical protein
MSPEEKLKMDLMLQETQSNVGKEWMGRFKEANPNEQYRLLNIRNEIFPIRKQYEEGVQKKASEQLNIPGTKSSYEELLQKAKSKQSLEKEKSKLKEEINWWESGA